MMTMPGTKISNAQENGSFAVSFIHLELRRECKGYMKVGEGKEGIGLQDS